MVLSYLPELIAKTETSSHPLPREFTLTSLMAMVGADDEERLLCPVRALRWYLRRTRSESHPRQLFLSMKNRECPLSKEIFSFFLRQLIKEAHKDFPEHLGPLLRIRTHDVRSVATSLLWSINRTVSDILEMASWRTQSVFADHYLYRGSGMTSSLLDPSWQQGVLSPKVAVPLSTLLTCLLRFTDTARIVGRLYTGINSLTYRRLLTLPG